MNRAARIAAESEAWEQARDPRRGQSESENTEPWSDIVVGDVIECRDVAGMWHEGIACSGARYDAEHAWNRKHVWLSVSVQFPTSEWPYNWPAEDVRKSEPGGENPE